MPSLQNGGTISEIKQDWGNVAPNLLTTNLLHKLAANPQHHTAKMLRLAARKTRLQGCILLARIARRSDRIKNDLALEDCLFGIDFKTAEGGDDGCTLGVETAGQEPAGRLREPVGRDGDNESEDDLEGDGEAPGQGGWSTEGFEWSVSGSRDQIWEMPH